MIGGFSPVPDKYRELLKRKTYGKKWYNLIIGFPLVLVLMLVWDCMVVPYRKLTKR